MGGIVILLMLLVSLILFVYFLVMTARGWGAVNTTLLCFLFIECWIFLVFAAGVQDNRVKNTKQAFQNRERAEAATERTEQLLWGNFDVSSVNLEAVVPVQGMLKRLTADRGRVWRGANFVQATANGFDLELAMPVAPAGDDGQPVAAQPNSESLPVNLVVYAFAQENNTDGQPVPSKYLGKFVVTQSNAGQISLNPTLAVDSGIRDYITAGSATKWTLYELLPLDNHRAFAAPGSEATDEAIFGRMDEDALRALFASVPEGERREALVDSYLRDGQRARDDDLPASVWVQVNMLKKKDFLVDSAGDADAREGGYFDIEGRSRDARLKREEQVSLGPNIKKRIVLKEEPAITMRDAGDIDIVQRIYVRPLIAYEEAFGKNYVQMEKVKHLITTFTRESAELDKANQLGQEMIAFRQVENQKLSADLASYQKEVALLTSELEEATQELAALKSKLSNMYNKVHSARRLTSTN